MRTFKPLEGQLRGAAATLRGYCCPAALALLARLGAKPSVTPAYLIYPLKPLKPLECHIV